MDRFTGCFTHLKTGVPPGERRALLTALLADGINMGLKRMAEACRGASFWQLARIVDWHVREETYVQATARLVDAQRALPIAALWIAALWGDGTMSSSGGQFFQAGGPRPCSLGDQRPVRQRAWRQLLKPPLRPVRRLLQQGHRGDGTRSKAALSTRTSSMIFSCTRPA